MSSARTPRHGAGDALLAPPRRAHPPANTHAHTAHTHTQRLTNTHAHPHTHPPQPHTGPRPCGHAAATASLPTDAELEAGSAHTRAPPTPVQMHTRGSAVGTAPRTHTHTSRAAVSASPPTAPEMQPRVEAAGSWSPSCVPCARTHGRAQCTLHMHSPFPPSRDTDPRQGTVLPFPCTSLHTLHPLTPTPSRGAQQCPQEDAHRQESISLTPLTHIAQPNTQHTRGLCSLLHSHCSHTCTHLPCFDKTCWWVLDKPTLPIHHNPRLWDPL